MDTSRILANDELREQLLAQMVSDPGLEPLVRKRGGEAALKSRFEGIAEGLEGAGDRTLEAIIYEFGRPALFIQTGRIEPPRLDFWKDRILAARQLLERALPSIGRIEVRGHPRLPWIGTGWIIAPQVIVTNRHVASEFGRRTGDSFLFRRSLENKPMKAAIDFKQEHDRAEEEEFRILDILHIEPEEDDQPDIAFLRVEGENADDMELPKTIPLAADDASEGTVVGAVGYAAWDGRRNPGEAMPRIFQNVYNVKRLHPGEVMSVRPGYLTHDCSTLGGNSGSVLLDFATGAAVGLHFAGSFLDRNYAVRSRVLVERMEALGIQHA